MKRFYTYFYFRKDGTPYYVGKGVNDRAFSGQHGIAIPERGRIVLQYWESADEAIEMEKYYIRLFGRKDLQTGILRNLTDGGEGASVGNSLRKGWPANNVYDMLGQRYGRLLVLGRVKQSTRDRKAMWVCQCDCGKKKIMSGRLLRGKHARSCGCLRRELMREIASRPGGILARRTF